MKISHWAGVKGWLSFCILSFPFLLIQLQLQLQLQRKRDPFCGAGRVDVEMEGVLGLAGLEAKRGVIASTQPSVILRNGGF